MFDPPNLALGLPGITPWTTGLTVTSRELVIRYGPWTLRTPLTNVAATEDSGPYALVKIAARRACRSATAASSFATRCSSGLCIRFRRPVPAILPWQLPLLTHLGAAPSPSRAPGS